MRPAYWEKQPWEDRVCQLDMSDSLASGDNVANASVAIYDAEGTDVSADMTSGTPSVLDNIIYFRIKGGTHGNEYWAEIRGTTANGDKIEEDLRIIVSDKRLEA
jgi:hypothetical protein